MIQRIDAASFVARAYALHGHNPNVERARAPTAVLLCIGMFVVYGISAVLWLFLLWHGYTGRRG